MAPSGLVTAMPTLGSFTVLESPAFSWFSPSKVLAVALPFLPPT
jgi:hypothetical protein